MRCSLLLLLFFTVQLHAQRNAVMPGLTEDYFRFVVNTLAHDSMKGREVGTAQEKSSARFIASEMKRAGCKFIRKKPLQPFTYKDPDSVMIQSAGNVIGKIDTRSKYSIVVSAHYDHIGKGRHHSKAPFTLQIHNGADDNSSGVAMLLGLAAWCKQNASLLNYDMIFVAFSGEEDGLHGSDFFVKSGICDTAAILCCLNFDMIGRLDLLRPILRIDGASDFAGWDSILPNDSANGFNVMRRRNIIAGGSDHCNFSDRHIPALLITTGLHSDYHTPADDADRINFKGMVNIAEYLREFLLNLHRRKKLAQEFFAC
jgi:hypothetical protein